MEAHLIEWTAKCSDIQEQSAASDNSVTSWPFADISKLAFTMEIRDVGKHRVLDILLRESRSYSRDFRDTYQLYFHAVGECATKNLIKLLWEPEDQ